MAGWKKVIVSGSAGNLSTIQVDNLTSGQVVIGGGSGSILSTTAINGTGTIVATTGATGLSHSGSFSGSFIGNGSGLTGITATNLTNALTIGEGLGGAASYNGSAAVTLTVSGAAQLSDNKIVKWNNTDGKFVDTSLTDNGTTVTGTTSLQLSGASSSLTGSFTGSFKGDGSQLTGIATTLNINASTGGPSTVSLSSQTLTIAGTTNEVETSVSGQTITVGLPNNVTIGNNLTVTGDLIVNGTTTTVNTTDLLIEDKFILLASGSAAAGDSGIIIDRGSDANLNIAFGFDADTDRWGFQNGLSDSTNAMTIGTNGNSAFAGLVFTETAHTSTKPTTGEFVKEGAIYTAADGTIWMYA